MANSSPELELQGSILQALTGDIDVAAFVGDRVYDTVPIDAELPYITFGPMDAMSLDADCITAFEINIQIDIWSQAVGQPEAKRILNAVRRALHDAELDLTDNALVMIEHLQSHVMRDPDGTTNHGIAEFVAFVEQR